MTFLRLIAGLFAGCLVCSCADEKREELILACGQDRVLMIDAATSDGEKINVVWQWQVADLDTQAPGVYQRYLPPVNDCKPVDGNSKILVTGGRGVVMIERATKKCLFYACTPNSHSAELLPGNRIAVALSVAEGGNSLRLYDAGKPDRILYGDSLYSGHGVVWLDGRRRLYALGFDELREYSLKDWQTDTPALQPERKWTLPGESGHDLSPVSKDRLLVTCHESVYLFDIAKETFLPFEPLSGVPDVKSVNCNEPGGRLIYTRAEESWWTFHIYQKQPDKTLTLPDIRLYKVRVMR
jgi:hypothetical protein